MPRRFKPPKRDLYLERMFETRSDAWEAAGLSVGESSESEVRRARSEALILIPLLVAVIIAYNHRADILSKHALKSLQTPLQIIAVIAIVAIGWALARAVGRAAGPSFMRRMDPATAGTVGFLIRLVTIGVALLYALSIAGVNPQTLAVGGAFTAVILGLAAQQTLGNVIAGLVLLSARPFRVGERVRLQAGAVGGQVEGTVSSLGLLYTTLTRGYDRILVPNNVVLAAAVVPLKEPDSVDVKVRLSSGVRPSQVQAILDDEITTPTRSSASVLLEEVDGPDLVVRVQATPELSNDGAKLADEIIAALTAVTGEHETVGEVEPDEDARDSRAAGPLRHTQDPTVRMDRSETPRPDGTGGPGARDPARAPQRDGASQDATTPRGPIAAPDPRPTRNPRDTRDDAHDARDGRDRTRMREW
jgi:small-conductance mechanosensitive channel